MVCEEACCQYGEWWVNQINGEYLEFWDALVILFQSFVEIDQAFVLNFKLADFVILLSVRFIEMRHFYHAVL